MKIRNFAAKLFKLIQCEKPKARYRDHEIPGVGRDARWPIAVEVFIAVGGGDACDAAV